MSGRLASMHHWSISTPTTSLALRLGKKRQPGCCSFKSKCARNSRPVPAKLPKRLRARSMRIPKTCFMCCGTWRATIPISTSRRAKRQLKRSFHLKIAGTYGAYEQLGSGTLQYLVEYDLSFDG